MDRIYSSLKGLLECFCVGYKNRQFCWHRQGMNILDFAVINLLSYIDKSISYDGQLRDFLLEYGEKLAGTHKVRQ